MRTANGLQSKATNGGNLHILLPIVSKGFCFARTSPEHFSKWKYILVASFMSSNFLLA
jgi:hypothetical protein